MCKSRLFWVQVGYVIGANWGYFMVKCAWGASRVRLGCKLNMSNGYFSRCKSGMPGVQFVCALVASRICLGCKLNMTNDYFSYFKSSMPEMQVEYTFECTSGASPTCFVFFRILVY